VKMVYLIENNGVYGLTKGQFSASADVGSKSKRGEANRMAPIDPVMLALSIGATFVARSFSGDKEQLIPILKAAFAHRGLALVDVVSPCVTFNDHEGSTKSYLYTRKHESRATETDFVPKVPEILAQLNGDRVTSVTMHDGSVLRFRTVPPGYDPRDRHGVMAYLQERKDKDEVVTGVLFVDETAADMHEMNNTPDISLTDVPYERLCPGAEALKQLQEEYR
jgi:2-oxoglutarate ferredoxin oxidoreductase subunit beta